MTSRERARLALNHKKSDRIPIDLGGHCCSGIHAAELNPLLEHLGLEKRTPKNLDAMMMLAYVDDDVRKALDVDFVGLYTKGTTLGHRNENYKPWKLPDGTEILMGGDFNCTYDEKGYGYAYPKGDMSAAPCAYMTTTGLYFDLLNRQEDLDAKTEWNGREDYKNDWTLFTDEDLEFLRNESAHYYNDTDYAIFGSYWQAGLGDNLLFAAPWLKDPKGVRLLTDWYMTMAINPEYIKEVFELQTEYSIKNMELYYEAVGDRIEVIGLTGTDFGSQHDLLISRDMYRELFMPYYKKVTTWVHEHTPWKTFMHTCGAVSKLIPDIIETGFDIVNPVQCSADGMDAATLKEKFGKDIVFWGGGCNPQATLINGTPEQVYEETKRNAQILGRDGGFIGTNVHNLQYGVPVENFIAELQAFKDVKF